MFLRLGQGVQRNRWLIIALWAAILVISLPLAPRLAATLKSGGFASDDLESVRARQLLEKQLGLYPNTFVAVFQSPLLTADDPVFQEIVARNLAAVQTLPGVVQVIPPSVNPRQISADRHTAYALIALDAPEEESRQLLGEVQSRLHDDTLTVLVSGGPVFYADIEDVSERDLRRAEIIAFPLGLLTLVLVLRSLVAAAVPVAVGGSGVVTALAALFIVGRVTDLSMFVMNMTTMLGLGLSIDYALFLTSRFREELQRSPPEEAVVVTMGAAGRAIFFSALTVLTGLLGLVTFDSMMLRSLGIAGAVVVGCAAMAALTLLPAMLAVLGEHINGLALPPLPGPRGVSWSRLATAVMRRPVAVIIPVLAALTLLGWPFLNVRLSAPDATILPAEMPSRQGFETLKREFGEGTIAPTMIVLQSRGSMLSAENLSALYDYTHALADDARVERVESIVDLDPRMTKEQYQLLYADGERLIDPYARASLAALARDNTTLVNVVSKYPMISSESQDLVRSIRSSSAASGFQVMVTGGSATIVDHVSNLYGNAPRAVGLVLLTTYLALYLLFRSVVIPLKAVLMNTLSIIASYGALVFVFQEGHFSNLLGFTAAGFVEASLPIVMFCFLFGVSMDYEVFLLTRIKEAYDRSGDNTRSVAEGLERSGRIITSAALIVVVVSSSFVAADIVLIKALGLGTAVAVFLDATVVRALLVPATMRLLGDRNWWAPRRQDAARIVTGGRTMRRGIPAVVVLGIGGSLLWSAFGGPAPQDTAPLIGEEVFPPQVAVGTGELRPIALPADEAPHDDLTEWWYYTGHLTADDGADYGFEFVVFQSVRGAGPVGYASHFAITDGGRRSFRYDQRTSTGRQGDQGDGFALRVGDWTMVRAQGRERLRAGMEGYALALELQSTKKPVLHNNSGIVSFGQAGDSYYYSRTRLTAAGTLAVDGVAKPVNGTAWMDHQWGNFLVLNRGGWDWMGLQLDDGSEVTVSIVRSAEGGVVMAYATQVDATGHTTHIPSSALSVANTGYWSSPKTGARYPSGWQIELRELDLSIVATPVLADQELDTRQTTGLAYWEGEVDLKAEQKGHKVGGKGYVELTGYATGQTEAR